MRLVRRKVSSDIVGMSTSEIIERIARMPAEDFVRVAEHVHAREDELLKEEIARRRDDLRSGRVKGLTHEEVFGPLKEKYGKGR
jgi:hypothetical protein